MEIFHGDLVNTNRIIYTPSDFAKLSLLHIQEIGYLQAAKPHVSRRDYLDSYLFFLVTSGEGSLEYEGYMYGLSEGDCVFIDTRQAYSHSTSENLWSLSWVHFNGPTADAIYQKYRERGGFSAFKSPAFESYRHEFDNLYKIASSASYTRDMEINTGLSKILSLLMADSWHPEGGHPDSKKTELLEIRKYLDENYAHKITLDGLAKRFNVNKYYLTRIFKEQFGLSIMDYLLSVRITQAKNMLRFTSLSAEEIGQKTGIGDAYYFSRVFKKVEGINAREYRRQWN